MRHGRWKSVHVARRYIRHGCRHRLGTLTCRNTDVWKAPLSQLSTTSRKWRHVSFRSSRMTKVRDDRRFIPRWAMTGGWSDGVSQTENVAPCLVATSPDDATIIVTLHRLGVIVP